MTGSPSAADVAEDQCLLLWNSEDWESAAIKAKYVQLHPGVLTFDLDIAYTHDHDNEPDLDGTYNLTDIEPAGCGITKRYITPCKFRELFLEEGCAFRTFLAAHPNILCIATTRGIPAAISDTLTPVTGSPQQPSGGIYASFEAALSRLRFGPLGVGADSIAFDKIYNPYFAFFEPDEPGTPLANLFDCYPFDAACCGSLDSDDDSLGVATICPGEIFAVSRLDSARAAIDYNIDGNIDHVDGVLAMLDRTQNICINKYAVTALFDQSPAYPGLGAVSAAYAATIALWQGRWCYVIEETDAEFFHGLADPNATPCPGPGLSAPPGVDCTYNLQWPVIGLVSLGRHHAVQSQVLPTYVSYYLPHPAGVLLSQESYNGWFLHAEEGSTMFPLLGYEHNHGQVYEWIRAGGGFTIGNIQEPHSSGIPDARALFKAFLVGRYCWGEAALASLPHLGFYQTPIGDPLAQVDAAYDPDISGPTGAPDRIVNNFDRNLVNLQFGQSGSGLQADINFDGTVNHLDRNLVIEAYGRNATEPPTVPDSGDVLACGNLNDDLAVDQVDLDIFDAYVAGVGGYQPCPLLEAWDSGCTYDFSFDGALGPEDRALLEEHVPTCFDLDLNDDGFIDVDDFTIFTTGGFFGAMCGQANYVQLMDLDCNCVVGGDVLGFYRIEANYGPDPCQP
jgi:hypothetical protein